MKNILIFLVLSLSLLISCDKEQEWYGPGSPKFYALQWDSLKLSSLNEKLFYHTIYDSLGNISFHAEKFRYELNKDTTFNLESLLLNPYNWKLKYFVSYYSYNSTYDSIIPSAKFDTNYNHYISKCLPIDSILKFDKSSLYNATIADVYVTANNGSFSRYLYLTLK